MDGRELFDALQLDDYAILDKQVQSLTINLQVLEYD